MATQTKDTKMTNQIYFYLRKDPWGWLSNFERTGFVVDGKKYATNEHYYQSKRTNNPIMEEYFVMPPVLGMQ